MTTDARPGRVFLSYSSKDKHWADAACARLESKGVRCWIAPRDIAPGTEWGASIISGIDACRVMVLIFSEHANQSPQVRREVERAVSKGMVIMPCRVEDVQPAGALEYALSNTHWLDIFTPPVEGRLQKLTEAVLAILNSPQPASSSQNPLRQQTTGRAPPVAPAAKAGPRLATFVVLLLCGGGLALYFGWDQIVKYQARAARAERADQEKAKAERARLVLSCEDKPVITIKASGGQAELPTITIKIERIECRGEVELKADSWLIDDRRWVPDGQSDVIFRFPDSFSLPPGKYSLKVEGKLRWSGEYYSQFEVKGGVDIPLEVRKAP
jgi:hypothetical protein